MDFKIVKEYGDVKKHPRKEKPRKIAIVALGISVVDYFQAVLKMGGNRHAVVDETWVINKAAGVLQNDLVFRMDDLMKSYAMNQHEFVKWDGEVNKIEDLWNGYLKNECTSPIMTSKAYPEFPTSVTFPLEDVINYCGNSYFNTTPAYALGYAIYLGVEEISLYGVDYSYPKGDHKAESGRACVEFWLKEADTRGIKIFVAQNSTLLDTNVPTENKLYGYDCTVEVRPHPDDEKRVRVLFRTDLDDEKKKAQKELELTALDTLIKKYKPHLLDAPERAVQEESLKGDQICQVQNEEPKESPT